jgi:two-component system cell cycle response regulator DivK
MPGEAILVVDDNAVNLKLARVLLEKAGYAVRTAADGVEALAALKDFRPRLILMDLQMPGLDGLQVTRLLKADPATAGIKVVALTAYAMKGDDVRAKAAGCDAYLPKPIDTRTFTATVAGLLEG